jgi:hypothetical protein
MTKPAAIVKLKGMPPSIHYAVEAHHFLSKQFQSHSKLSCILAVILAFIHLEQQLQVCLLERD